MKSTDTHAFANQLLVCLLVSICLGGSVGLGAVWMRHQISVTANSNRRLAARIAEVERNCDETKALIAAAQGPDVLRIRNADWHLGFDAAKDDHLVHVNEDPVPRLAARRNPDVFLGDRLRPAVSFTVALKN